jgi:hypothetical protein
MRKILLIATILCISLGSCTYNKVSTSTTIPNDVVQSIPTLKIDTVYSLKTVNYHYYFDKNKQLIEKYNVDLRDISIVLPLLLLIIMIIFLLGLAIGINP